MLAVRSARPRAHGFAARSPLRWRRTRAPPPGRPTCREPKSRGSAVVTIDNHTQISYMVVERGTER